MRSDLIKSIGDVTIALTMASLAFMLFFFDMYDKTLRHKVSEAKGKNHQIEDKLIRHLSHTDVVRWICAILAGCFFVIGASLVIASLIMKIE